MLRDELLEGWGACTALTSQQNRSPQCGDTANVHVNGFFLTF